VENQIADYLRLLCLVACAGTERRSAIYAPVWLPRAVRPGRVLEIVLYDVSDPVSVQQ
jgi:hypothetical protein